MSPTRASRAIGRITRRNRNDRATRAIRAGPPQRARAAGCAQQIAHSSSSIWWATNPNGSEASRSISEVAEEVAGPVRRQRELEREFEEEHRADRQVGPGEEHGAARPRARGPHRSSTASATIRPKRTRIRTSTVFSRIATNRRPKSFSIRRASSFSCHSRSHLAAAHGGPTCACFRQPLAAARSSALRFVPRAASKSFSAVACAGRLRPSALLTAPGIAPGEGRKISSGKSEAACRLCSTRGHRRQDFREPGQVVANQLEPINRASRGSYPRGKPSFRRLRRAPPGQRARRGQPGRQREATAICWLGGPGQLARRRPACRSNRLRSDREACVECVVASRQIELSLPGPVTASGGIDAPRGPRVRTPQRAQARA